MKRTTMQNKNYMKHRIEVQFWNQKVCQQKHDPHDIKCFQLTLGMKRKV